MAFKSLFDFSILGELSQITNEPQTLCLPLVLRHKVEVNQVVCSLKLHPGFGSESYLSAVGDTRMQKDKTSDKK